MFVLLLTIFVDLVGFGMVFPLLPFFAKGFGASAFEVSLLIATYSAMQMIAAPLWGRLSDRFGRKLILLTTLAGGGLSYVWFGYAESLPALFAARALAGLMAGNISVAQAYMSDITPAAERAGAMGRLGAAFGFGFVVGPALTGLLIGDNPGTADFHRPCLAAAGISFFAVLLGLAILREPDRRSRRQENRKKLLTAATANGIPAVILLSFVVIVVFTQLIAIFPLWTEARIDWGAREVGYAYAYIGLCIALLQGFALGIVNRRIGEFQILLLGATSMSAGLLLLPFFPSLPGFLGCGLLLCLGSSFCYPTFTAIISQRAGEENQGAVLGLANAVGSLGRIIGPPLAGIGFDHIGPDWPFLSGGLMLWLVILAIALLAYRQRRT